MKMDPWTKREAIKQRANKFGPGTYTVPKDFHEAGLFARALLRWSRKRDAATEVVFELDDGVERIFRREAEERHWKLTSPKGVFEYDPDKFDNYIRAHLRGRTVEVK